MQPCIQFLKLLLYYDIAKRTQWKEDAFSEYRDWENSSPLAERIFYLDIDFY